MLPWTSVLDCAMDRVKLAASADKCVGLCNWFESNGYMYLHDEIDVGVLCLRLSFPLHVGPRLPSAPGIDFIKGRFGRIDIALGALLVCAIELLRKKRGTTVGMVSIHDSYSTVAREGDCHMEKGIVQDWWWYNPASV